MFSILVHGNDTAWETDQLMRIDKRRFKEYSDSEADSIVLEKPESMRALEKDAALLMYERGSKNAGVVRYGFLRNIRTLNQDLVFNFSEEGIFDRTVIEEFSTRLGMNPSEESRTHWAIKDGGIPSAMLQKLRPSYDVVLSFAGEDREYVEEVANTLRQQGIKVFYDRFEEVELWGKHLTEHFDIIYRQSGKYCVIFISEHYAEKRWTNHERKMALARAFSEKREYILPANFDSTELPGIPQSVAYISLLNVTPTAFASLILSKLGRIS